MKKAIMTVTLEIGVDLEEVEKLLGGVSSEVGMHMTNVFLTRTDVNEAQFRRMSVDMVPFGGAAPATNE